MKSFLTMLFTLTLALPLFAAEPVAETAPAAAPASAPAADAAPAKSSLATVEGLSVGTGVLDRVLQGAAPTFSAAVGRVYCHNKVMASSTPTTIRHIWSKDGTPRGDVSLNVGGNGWRNWSSHAVEPGSWKVDVLDADGALVDSVSFTVTE